MIMTFVYVGLCMREAWENAKFNMENLLNCPRAEVVFISFPSIMPK